MTATTTKKRRRNRRRGGGGGTPPVVPIEPVDDRRRGPASSSFDWLNGRWDLFAGRYELGEWIGRGQYKTFYRARDDETGGDCVVGIFDHHTEHDVKDCMERHLHVQACGHHSNLMTIIDTGIAIDNHNIPRVFVTAEPIYSSVTLNQAVQQRGGPLPVPAVLHCAYGVLSGLAHLHANGLCHGSCHSQNILVSTDGSAVIVDYDWVSPTGWNRVPETMSGLTVVVGRHQLSPEGLRGLPHDERTDLYIAGLALYRAATGLHPFDHETYPDNESRFAGDAGHDHDFLARLDRLPTTPSAINPRLPKRVSDMLMRLLTPNPDYRPQSASAALEELLAIQFPYPGLELSTAIRKGV